MLYMRYPLSVNEMRARDSQKAVACRVVSLTSRRNNGAEDRRYRYEDCCHSRTTPLFVAARTECIGNLVPSSDLDSGWCMLVPSLCVTVALHFQSKLVRVLGSLAPYMLLQEAADA